MHKRAYGAVAVSGVAALALSACGGSSPAPPTPDAGASSAAATAPASAAGPAETLATGADAARDASADLVIWSDADRSAAIQKYADQFGQENGIKVKVQISTDTRQQFKDATKVGKGPDVIVGAHDWLGELVQNSTVAPVNLSSDVASKFLPQAIAATKFNGQSYGVPYAVENIGLMYNKDLVPTPPRTMSELVSVGEKLMKEGKTKGVLSQFVSKVGNAYFAYPYFSAFPGGGIFGTTADGGYDPNKLLVDSAGSVDGGKVLVDLGKKKVLSTNVDDTNQDALFDTKAVPFMISGPWSVGKAADAGINYGIAPLPSLDSYGGGAMKPFLGVQMFYVSSKAKNAALAQEFVTNYIPRKDVQLALFEVGKRPPALTEAYDEVSAKDADVKAWFEAGKDGLPMPNIPAMNSVWGPFGQATADLIAGKADAKSRLDAAAKEIAANIKKG
ncbi:MAG: maltose ABC transporter substrate-binding protein [Terracoccus sp.]